MTNESVWIVDDDSSIRWVLQKALQAANIGCLSFENPQDLLLQLQSGQAPEVIISDIRMPQMDGMTLLNEVHVSHPMLPVIIMTAHSDLDSAVNAYQKGAFEYLPKPFDIDEAVTLTQRALAHAREQSRTQQAVPDESQTEIIGEAPAMQEVFRAIGRLSRSSISVLINGQSGTGKELVAHALHRHSPRSSNPFIALNMAAIPADLVESELFGHEKGAFTGAQTTRQGRFEQADGGTLFLDEIGDMPLDVQTRLLRVLADGQFYRVGGHQSVSVDVRIIAATHQNLEQRVAEGKFREDLFHRLNVIRVHLPSLSERREDIPLLARHFLRRAAKELDVEAKSLSKDAEKLMAQLPWPGNVRQLENVCRWLTVMASGQEVLPSDLPPEIHSESSIEKASSAAGDWPELLASWTDKQLKDGHYNILNDAMLTFEKIMLERALQHTHGHKQDAAKRLGWGRNTLTRKLKELGIS
ncbi:MAG TPA: nitrogen regulation protein NR(I) [Alteromonas australica]|jgi:two-component system nitrogen regulation response regulator GlnG|uniref:DNA-binding transcriptional regulator NtrC n=1 Tax=Alteromonas australica TaxID=589873 RepID=A0A075P2I1_9ALTE|nr:MULTISPECIES: nitrogen regulation protein NR(I) [Alteromonas]MAO29460.1 nitrogen regulation protein NR(I) [Alteromonas sp.]AIF99933.1 nitrogen regulation protein NR(I) [Alteromonas australica]AJP44901.1 nitrogen regulation protein NR(I) [Alteromonas australica]MBU34408.1 nitrogen regulation protein NR(I) [Alteromonas sp.]QPL50832.1 nitrogen regulation protein NR(I) [Alteromonas sp. B31-7]|tara:strand:+ start:7013 stop:8422 length:1410 start_codon:yes stop_codon:yes gene_type:complete